MLIISEESIFIYAHVFVVVDNVCLLIEDTHITFKKPVAKSLVRMISFL